MAFRGATYAKETLHHSAALREKAEKVGLTPTDVFSTLQLYLGSQYVNDFNYLGRTYQVIAQADGSFHQGHKTSRG